MLPRKNRLINKKDFELVYRYGSFFSFGEVSLRARKVGSDFSRIGFSIGLNYSKKATVRNSAKRKLREIVRKNLAKIKKGMDIVVLLNKKAENNPKKSAPEQDFLKAFEKGKLLIK